MMTSARLDYTRDPSSIASPTVSRVLSRLFGVKRSGDGWLARCPAHDDQHPSLSISEGDDGRVLLKCFGGCETEAVVRALGLSMADLFLDAPKGNGKSERKIVATYPYVNANGRTLFEVVRFEPKGFAQRRPDGNGGYIYNLEGVQKVLYRLPEVLAAVKAGQIVFIVEGEKDADNLNALSLTATTNPGGACKWRDEYSEALRGAQVVIIPDRDEPGRRHAEAVAKSLCGKAASVRVIELPDGKDVSDWLTAGHTKDELLSLVSQAQPWEPTTTPIGYQKLLEVFSKWLYLNDDAALRFVLCAVIANRLPGDPLWAFVVGPSGSSKTELLNALSGLDFVKPLDTLTTATFLSGRQNKDPNASLLLRVPDGTIFLMRDFSSVLEMHTETRAEIFAQLRKIYDGHLVKCTGEGGESAEIAWRGKVGLLAAVTPAIENYRAFATTLGERFLYYHIHEQDRASATARALRNRESLQKMRDELRDTVRQFFEGLQIPQHVELPEDAFNFIVRVADFVATARSSVARDYYAPSRDILDIPQPEVPTRLAQQLGALACAHAVLFGRSSVTDADLEIVAHTALTCIPSRRRAVLGYLADVGVSVETSTVAEALDLPTQTVRRDLEDLTSLRLLKREKLGEGRADLWMATEATIAGWRALTGTREKVQNTVQDATKPTFPEKPGEAYSSMDTIGGALTGFSGKVPKPASGTEKPTLTQASDDDDEIPF